MDAALQLGDWVLDVPVETSAEAVGDTLLEAGLISESTAEALVAAAVHAQQRLAIAFYALSLQGHLRELYRAESGVELGGVKLDTEHASTANGEATPETRVPSSWPTRNDHQGARDVSTTSNPKGDRSKRKSLPKPDFSVGQRVKSRWMGASGWYKGFVQRVNAPSSDSPRATYTYDIQYDDGDFETGQRPNLMKLLTGEPPVRVIDFKYWDSWLLLALLLSGLCAAAAATLWTAMVIAQVITAILCCCRAGRDAVE